MSLLSLVLTLRASEQTPAPPALGRAAHAILLNTIAQNNPALAQELHADTGVRPFTCSSLMGKRRDGNLTPAVPYALRYTALTAPVADSIAKCFAPGMLLQFEQAQMVIEQIASEATQHPWASRTDYEQLSARWLLARATPATRLTFRFASPTAFRQAGKAQLLPLPDLVFGSLLEKWNAFAPLTLSPDARRFAAECLAVSRFEIETHAAPFKSEGAIKTGAVGTVTYIALNHDRYWLSIINLLADYAQFAGIGISTTMGMGQARKMLDG